MYEWYTVEAATAEGEQVGEVDVRVPQTEEAEYTGLSDTESLDENEGMLFTHDTVDNHGYVMREMSIPLDIVWADETGTITNIANAPVPSSDADEDDPRVYVGWGKYVLETNRGWMEDHGVTRGDQLDIPDAV